MKNFSIYVKKSDLLSSIEEIESVIRAWYEPDYNTKRKHGCVLRSSGDDLVIDVGYDSVNKSDIIFTSLVTPGVCSKCDISSLVLHTDLLDAVNKCETSNIEISGSTNDDGGPLYFNDNKVRRIGAKPWKMDSDWNEVIFDVNVSSFISKASKCWHGFKEFAIEGNAGGIWFYAQGKPNIINRDVAGNGFVSNLSCDSTKNFPLTRANINAIKAIAQTSKDRDESANVMVKKGGIVIKWNNGKNRVICKGNKDPGYFSDIKSRASLSKYNTAGYFDRFKINNLYYSGRLIDGMFVDYSQTTLVGSYVDCSVKSSYGASSENKFPFEMKINASDSVLRVFSNQTTSNGSKCLELSARIDLNSICYCVPMMDSQMIGVMVKDNYAVFLDGSDKYIFDSVEV
jgi:hypothetical protein